LEQSRPTSSDQRRSPRRGNRHASPDHQVTRFKNPKHHPLPKVVDPCPQGREIRAVFCRCRSVLTSPDHQITRFFTARSPDFFPSVRFRTQTFGQRTHPALTFCVKRN
jgi:hypothetical protein